MYATNFQTSSLDNSIGSGRVESSDIPGSPSLDSGVLGESRPVARLDAPRDAESSILVLPVRLGHANSSRFDPEPASASTTRTPAPASAASESTSNSADATPLHAQKITHLPFGWKIEGSIDTNDPTRINCHVVGAIKMAEDVPVVLDELSVLDGSATSTQIEVHGTVHGDVLAGGGKVVIHASSRINGEVQYRDVQILGGIHEMMLKHTTQRA